MSQPVRLLDVQQAARTAGCHPETIRRAIRRKELLAQREPVKRGRGFIITTADLAAWLEKRRIS
jgi:excisionase family DNA binding protein